jgi:hypothetical protein
MKSSKNTPAIFLSAQSRGYEEAAKLYQFLSKLEHVQVKRALLASQRAPDEFGQELVVLAAIMEIRDRIGEPG